MPLDLPLRLHKSAGVPVSAEVRRLIRAADGARDDHDWDKAAENYRRALDLDPALSHIWTQLGHALKEASGSVGAEAAYRRAIELAPKAGDPHLHLGHLLKRQRRMDEAVQAYVEALELAPASPEPLEELLGLAAQGVRIRSALFRTLAGGSPGALLESRPSSPGDSSTDALAAQAQAALAALAERLRQERGEDDQGLVATLTHARESLGGLEQRDAPDASSLIVFDASDLIHHFGHSRSPSGIQRVQLEVVMARLRAAPGPVCSLSDHIWVEIPGDLMLALCEASLSEDDQEQSRWRALLRRLTVVLATAEPFHFPRGAWLVALGTSWHSEYLLQVRAAKEAYDIRYVPFVHDLIPVKTPEFCLAGVVRDYVAWLTDVFQYADAFFTNSESTRRDFLEASAQLGRTVDPDRVVVVRLDADIRKPQLPVADRRRLRSWGLERTPYVLFVATIEPRKNHLAAFSAWERLVREHGPERTPKLVCVGGRGWMNESILAMLDNSDGLKRQVTTLSGISDADLAVLYANCLFTLYPSHYEGWGLPVTESLCYGKTPLIADNSSLPEAGSGLAEVFQTGSDASLYAALERLIFDAPYRAAKEAAIKTFRPRPWAEVAAALDRAVRLWSSEPPEGADRSARDSANLTPLIALGRYYPIARNRLTRLTSDAAPGGPLRSGLDWHRLEDWGCWSRLPGFGLAARAPRPPSGRLALYLGVQGLPGRESRFTCLVAGRRQREGVLPAWQTRWLSVELEWPQQDADLLEIDFQGSEMADLAENSDGADTRVVGPGAVGIYVCDAADVAAKIAIVEAISLGFVDDLAQHSTPVSKPAEVHGLVVGDAGAAPSLTPGPDLSEPNGTEREVVLMQSCDSDTYYDMLAQSARTTRLYCQRHGLRYELFVGLKRGDLPWHATYNRIDLLSELVARDFRGWVLYVDADAWIADLDFDVRAFLGDKGDYAMIAAPSGDQSDYFWNVNIGVMLFNLGHPFTRTFVAAWEEQLSQYDLRIDARGWNVEIADDQGMFHQILDKHEAEKDLILHVDKDLLNSPWASFVRQLIRAENPDFGQRLGKLTREVERVLGVDGRIA